MSTTLWAQDNQYEQVMADIMQLQRDSSQLVADTLASYQQIVNLRDSIRLSKQRIAQADSLCQQLDQTLDKDAISRLEDEVNALQEDYDQLLQTQEQLTAERQQRSQQLTAQEQQLNSSTDVLNSLQQQQQQTSMRTLMGSYWELYNDGMQALSAPYSQQKVKDLRARLKPLISDKKKTKLNAAQFAKMDSLDICLSRFKGGVQRLQQLMDDINNDATVKQLRQEANDANRETCLNAIRPYIFPEEGSERDNINKRYFINIPYLITKLRDYWNELQNNPFDVPTKTEKEIKGISL